MSRSVLWLDIGQWGAALFRRLSKHSPESRLVSTFGYSRTLWAGDYCAWPKP